MSTPKMSDKTNSNYSTILNESGMRACFEDHLLWLKNRSTPHVVDKNNAYRYHHDLSAYLNNLGLEIGLHWLYMRVNDMRYNWDFTEDTEVLLFPNPEDIESLIALHSTISR